MLIEDKFEWARPVQIMATGTTATIVIWD